MTLFRGAGTGILITDDIEQEFISREKPEVVVETEYAQELSWLLSEISTNLQATLVLANVKQLKCDRLKDEVLSCAAGLNDLAEKM